MGWMDMGSSGKKRKKDLKRGGGREEFVHFPSPTFFSFLPFGL